VSWQGFASSLKCDYCWKEEDLPFNCNYCGGTFCADHRLPEAHLCKGDITRKPYVTSSSPYSRSWDNSSTSSSPGKPIFSRIEVRDILIAWVALAFAFALAQIRTALFSQIMTFSVFSTIFVASLVAVGSGFVLHELMHKFTAEHYGYWAEFRMWVFGILLALGTAIAGFIFAAPGATYIQGYNVTDRENGIISLAGPATNITIALLFLPILQLRLFAGSDVIQAIAHFAFSVNLILATFNMIPLMPLDGAKVFRWSKPLWAVIFFPLVIAVYIGFSGGL